MLDVGTVEKTTTDKGWNDPAEINADPLNTVSVYDEIQSNVDSWLKSQFHNTNLTMVQS